MSFPAQESVPLGKAAPKKFHDGNGEPPLQPGIEVVSRSRPSSDSVQFFFVHRSYRIWPLLDSVRCVAQNQPRSA